MAAENFRRSPFPHRQVFAKHGDHPEHPQSKTNRRQGDSGAYRDFVATELYCPKCRTAVPTKERHLLYLPTGDLFDYVCTRCGSSLGSRTTAQ